jgi:hypothetical protein
MFRVLRPCFKNPVSSGFLRVFDKGEHVKGESQYAAAKSIIFKLFIETF